LRGATSREHCISKNTVAPRCNERGILLAIFKDADVRCPRNSLCDIGNIAVKSVANLAEDREGQIFVRPARFSQSKFCSVHNPWQSCFGSTPGRCVRPESCSPTLGVRCCHLPYLESYLPHSLLRVRNGWFGHQCRLPPPYHLHSFLAQGLTHWAKRSLFCRSQVAPVQEFSQYSF
jgi:hypothetical protein